MRTRNTEASPGLLSRGRSRLTALQSSVIAAVIGLILTMTMVGGAQDKSGKAGQGKVRSVSADSYADKSLEPKPNADLKSLDRLVGKWRLSDPTGVTGGITGQISYEWMEGGFFLIQRFDLEHDGRKIKGIEIIGHEQAFGAEPSRDIKSRVYDIAGNTLDYVYELKDDTLTIWGGQRGSGAYFKGRFSEDQNTCSGGWVYPGGGGYKATMTRIK